MKKVATKFFHLCLALVMFLALNSCTSEGKNDSNPFDLPYNKGEYYMEISINNGHKDKTDYHPYWASSWGENAKQGLVGMFENTDNEIYSFGLFLVVDENESAFIKNIKPGTSIKVFASQNITTPGLGDYMDSTKGLGLISVLNPGSQYSKISVVSNGTATIKSVTKVKHGYKVKGVFQVKYYNQSESEDVNIKGEFSLPVLIY